MRIVQEEPTSLEVVIYTDTANFGHSIAKLHAKDTWEKSYAITYRA